jgi:hypothetical protein
LFTIQMHAMSQDRTARQGAEAVQALQRPGIAARERIGDIGRVLCHVDVHDGAQIFSQASGGADRVVRHGEARVQSDQATQQR